MSNSRFLLAVMLIIVLPSALFALGMEGFVDEVFLQTKDVGRVRFSHSVHGTGCVECHPNIFIKKNNSNQVGMAAMEQGKSCGACHNGKRAFSVAENCANCHAGDIFYRDKENGNVNFSHANHSDMFGCSECHPDLFKAEQGANKLTMEAMEEGEFCGACHDGDSAFSVAEDCESCHDM
jgi:c(7)-type cytochrome triheme protein